MSKWTFCCFLNYFVEISSFHSMQALSNHDVVDTINKAKEQERKVGWVNERVHASSSLVSILTYSTYSGGLRHYKKSENTCNFGADHDGPTSGNLLKKQNWQTKEVLLVKEKDPWYLWKNCQTRQITSWRLACDSSLQWSKCDPLYSVFWVRLLLWKITWD